MRQRVARHLALILMAGGGLIMTAGPASAVVDRDCGDFASQRAAQIFFLKHGGPNSDPHGLDAEGDGVACESNPAPYYYGTSLPNEPKPEPKPTKVSSTIRLDLSRAKAIEGEQVKLLATVKPEAKRTVVFQKRADRRWKAMGRKTTTSRGLATLALRAPRTTTQYRAVVLKKDAGRTIYLGDTSNDKKLSIQRQKARLSLSRSSVVEGNTVRAQVSVSPVRRGRSVALEIFRNDGWRTLRTGQENRQGQVSFKVPVLDVGQHRLRATVQRANGASAHRSDIERLEIRDVTAPSAPTDVVATPMDGAASLSWAAVSAPDVHHYVVMYRTAEATAWTYAGETDGTAFTVGGLTNGVQYFFAISAVDTSGNVSPASAEVSATPMAPVVVP